MKKLLTICTIAICIFANGIEAQSADDLEKDIRQNIDPNEFVPLEDLPPLDVDKDIANKHIFQFGLATSVSYFYGSHLRSNEQTPNKGSSDESNGLLQTFIRPWGKYHFQEKYSLHAKGKFAFKHWDKQSNYSTNPSEVPRAVNWGSLEEFYSELRFGTHRVNVGRKFFRLGRGILFNDIADGAEYTWRSRYGGAKAFTAFSGDYSPCELSVKGCGDQYVFDPVSSRDTTDTTIKQGGKRMFFAGQVNSPRYYGGEVYLVGLYSLDMVSEASATKKTAFNPWYLGLGLRGFIVNASYRYSFEGIYAGGTTIDASTNSYKTSNISAFGGIFEFKYSLPWFERLIKPNVNFQYAIGSGEADKDTSGTLSTNNPTSDPVQKNISGDYKTFYYFGAYSGGLGLRPRLANIQAFRLGFSVKPMYFIYKLRNFGVISTFSIYRKVNKEGFISDTKAKDSSSKPINSADVGMAYDAILLYNVSSELKIFYSFGLFKPGKAYPETDPQDNKSGREVRLAHFISVTTIF